MKTQTTRFRFLWRTVLYAILCFPMFGGPLTAGTRLDSLLIELDRTLREQSQYQSAKTEYIDKLKRQLDNPYLSEENQYFLCQQLTQEYESFRCDTALLYSLRCLELAEKTAQGGWILESKLKLARIFAKASLFDKALCTLRSIPKEALSSSQRITYYKCFFETYVYLTECYPGEYDIDHWQESRLAYHDSLLTVLSPDTYPYAVHYGTKYIESGAFDKAEDLLLSYLPEVKPETADYALFTSILAYLYERKGAAETRKEYLAISAISDLKACVKENISLRFLASLLFNSGDVERANRYIQQSMEDANFYGASLRNLQSAKVFPIIVGAYQTNRMQQQQKLTRLLAVETLLAAILLLAVGLVVRQKRKLAKAQREILQINARLNELNHDLSEANEAQRKTNLSLAEANYIKEQFIGSFLDICTFYIDKFTHFKTFVGRKIKVGQTADILKLIEKTDNASKELKDLYTLFDQTFLSIYPDFVAELNKLLREEERYPAGETRSLNHELRVFALIRLGITDANKIAIFLHYALRTVYNYRSKVKSKTIDPDEDFEEKVKHLCRPDARSFPAPGPSLSPSS